MQNTLFLFVPLATGAGLQAKIYDETIRCLSQQFSQAVTGIYSTDEQLIKEIQTNKIDIVVSSNELPLQAGLILKGLGVVTIVFGANAAQRDLFDIVVDPLLVDPQQGRRSVSGLRYLLPEVLKKHSATEVAGCIGIDESTLIETVRSSSAEQDLFDVISLFKKLGWDSDFFGCNVGYVSCQRLTPNVERKVKHFSSYQKIDVLEYLCDCHDKLSVQVAESSGYSFVDIRLTFERRLKNLKPAAGDLPFSIRKAVKADIPVLRTIADGIYKDSRYFFDGNFPVAKVIEFYNGWVEKAVLGTFDNYAYLIVTAENKVAGFCTIRERQERTASIGLFGVDNNYRGQGVGNILLDAVCSKLAEQGLERIEVVTQGRNYSAQRLYQKSGFLTLKTELWYHKWFK